MEKNILWNQRCFWNLETRKQFCAGEKYSMKPEMFLKPAPVLLVILQKVVLVLHLPNLNMNTKVWNLLQIQIQKQTQNITCVLYVFIYLFDVFSFALSIALLKRTRVWKLPIHKLAHWRVFLNVSAHILWFSSLQRICTKNDDKRESFKVNSIKEKCGRRSQKFVIVLT